MLLIYIYLTLFNHFRDTPLFDANLFDLRQQIISTQMISLTTSLRKEKFVIFIYTRVALKCMEKF